MVICPLSVALACRIITSFNQLISVKFTKCVYAKRLQLHMILMDGLAGSAEERESIPFLFRAKEIK